MGFERIKGNAISAYPLIERYGVDAVRYYLVSEVPFGENGTFTPEQFVMRINQDLANNLGNLLNRTVSMIAKYFNGVIPSLKKGVNPTDKELEDLCESTISEYEKLNDDLAVTEAYEKVMGLVGRANKYIEETALYSHFVLVVSHLLIGNDSANRHIKVDSHHVTLSDVLHRQIAFIGRKVSFHGLPRTGVRCVLPSFRQ